MPPPSQPLIRKSSGIDLNGEEIIRNKVKELYKKIGLEQVFVLWLLIFEKQLADF